MPKVFNPIHFSIYFQLVCIVCGCRIFLSDNVPGLMQFEIIVASWLILNLRIYHSLIVKITANCTKE